MPIHFTQIMSFGPIIIYITFGYSLFPMKITFHNGHRLYEAYTERENYRIRGYFSSIQHRISIPYRPMWVLLFGNDRGEPAATLLRLISVGCH